MKKILTILCAVLCIFGLVACNPAPEQNQDIEETGPLTYKDFLRLEKATEKATKEIIEKNIFEEVEYYTATYSDGTVITEEAINLDKSYNATASWQGNTLKSVIDGKEAKYFFNDIEFKMDDETTYPEGYKKYLDWNKTSKIKNSTDKRVYKGIKSTFTYEGTEGDDINIVSASYEGNNFSYKVSITHKPNDKGDWIATEASINGRALSSDQLKDDKLVSLIGEATQIMMH